MTPATQLYFPALGVACAVKGCTNAPVILAFPGGVPVCVVHEELVRRRYANQEAPTWRISLEQFDA